MESINPNPNSNPIPNEAPLFETLPIDYHPQANEFTFEEDKLTFSSKFDSGNLFSAQRTKAFSVNKIKNNFSIISKYLQMP